MPAEQPRTYAAAHFGLELGNSEAMGLFRSIEGGGVRADVMTYQFGHGYDRWRQLGRPKFEDIKLQVGMAMSKPFYDWVKSFVEGDHVRKDGAIVAADFYYNERARREFKNALIKELTFPKLDAQDKNAAYMTLALAVEEMEFKPGGGKKITQPQGMDQQKLWTACNFRLSLDGFEQACRRVTKIESFTIKQQILEYHRGGFRHTVKTGGQIDFPNITFYVPEADAQPFLERFTKRGIEGSQRSHGGQKAGELVTYDNEGRPLFTLQFYEADILSVTPDKSESQSEEVKQVKIELFTERMTFEYAAMEVV